MQFFYLHSHFSGFSPLNWISNQNFFKNENAMQKNLKINQNRSQYIYI